MDDNYCTGIIVDCDRARIYASVPNRSLMGFADEGDEILVDLNDQVGDYYHIYTETSISGYCNKRYIEVPQ